MKPFLPILLLIIVASCQEDNKPPVCIITNPEKNTSFHLGDTISINIFATDPDGDIDEIAITFNGTSLVALHNEPFQYSLNSESYQSGNHSIAAVARDNGGLEARDEIQIILTPSIPVVNTGAIDSITSGSALVYGEVTSTGGKEIISRGICWNTLENPTIIGDHTVEGSGSGVFQSKITDLLCGTQYFVRAYASNKSRAVKMPTSSPSRVRGSLRMCFEVIMKAAS